MGGLVPIAPNIVMGELPLTHDDFHDSVCTKRE